MRTHTEFVRPAGPGKGDPGRLSWVAWLTLLLIASPAVADPGADAAFQPQVFRAAAMSAVAEASDGELQGVQAKGIEQQTLRASENVAVILWDEPDTGRRTGLPKNDGNTLVTIRYTGPAR